MEYVKLSLLFKEKPPYFIGSQLCGALGYALKNIVCINPNKICENCYASGQCLYCQFYEHKNDYHKYRLDFELNKSYYDFNFYLFCDAVNSLPIIISAFHFSYVSFFFMSMSHSGRLSAYCSVSAERLL